MSDRRAFLPLAVLIVSLALFPLDGCGAGADTEYGSSSGQSINGTSVLAAALKARGHDVEGAVRLGDGLASWARGIIRFAPYPGPPDRAEAQWYEEWLAADPDRWLIYVVGDFDASSEYWTKVVRDLEQANQKEAEQEARQFLAEAGSWYRELPPKSPAPADAATWFKVDKAWEPPRVCTSLSGPWAAGSDVRALGLTLHEALAATGGTVLLAADGKAFVIEKSLSGENRLLVIANGSFLLNEALVEDSRSRLLAALFDWIGPDPCPIALLEGSDVLAGADQPLSLVQLLKRLPAFRWVAIQIAVAALCAALARAARLGRPRDDLEARPDRPAAHAEALGALLARSRTDDEAQAIVAHYRSWRHPRTLPQNTTSSYAARSAASRRSGAFAPGRDLAPRAARGKRRGPIAPGESLPKRSEGKAES